MDPKQKRKYDLLAATEAGHTECVEKLIGEGRDISVVLRRKWPRRTALLVAASNGKTQILKLLLQAG